MVTDKERSHKIRSISALRRYAAKLRTLADEKDAKADALEKTLW